MKKILPYLTNCIVIMSFFLGSIYYVTIDTDFYQKQYEKNKTAEHIGISEENLMEATNVLIDYMENKVDSLDIDAKVKGVDRQIFDQRERDHMVDVKALFQLLKKSFITLILIGVALVVANILVHKKEGIRLLTQTFVKTAMGFVAVVALLAIVFILNFDWFWTNFHLLVFTNDLWLLDPKVSIMINMFPLNFFYACCFRILTLFVGDILLLGLISYSIKNKIVL